MYSIFLIFMNVESACQLVSLQDNNILELKRAYAACPRHDVNLVMGDANAKVGREPTIGKHSLHESTNINGFTLVDFATGRQMVIKSRYFMHKRIHLQTWHSQDGHTFNQIDHCLSTSSPKTSAQLFWTFDCPLKKNPTKIWGANPPLLESIKCFHNVNSQPSSFLMHQR
jgi:hypothetical protein